jgi:hypothetical protein
VRETRRYFGLELAGAKNQKTSLAVLEFYPKEKKIFLLDIFDRITQREDQTTDEALLEVIHEMDEDLAKIAVNVPLELPPCICCTRKDCASPSQCLHPSVKWVNANFKKSPKSKEFTPYTQRPIEIWIRHEVFPQLPKTSLFEIDETLGGNKAPLTARMHFLKKHLSGIALVEVWPKLSVAILAHQMGIPKRVVSTYRQLENGIQSREEILTRLAKEREIFIYEADMRKLSQSLACFDAFICAFTALLSDQNECVKAPTGFPINSGWIEYPELSLTD